MKLVVVAWISTVLLGAGAVAASGQSTPVVVLDDALKAAIANGPDLKLAKATLDGAAESYAATVAKNGFAVGASGTYLYEGNLPGITTSTSASIAQSAASANTSSTLVGQNIQGGVSLTGPATKVSLSAENVVPAPGTTSDTASLFALSASQTVFDGYPGGRAQATVQEGLLTYRQAQVAYEATAKNVDSTVRQEYYTLLGDQDAVNTRQANVAQAKEDLTRTQGFFSAQRATTLDVLQAQVAETQAELDLATAVNTVAIDRKTLSATLGWDLDKAYSVTESQPLEIPATDYAAALKTAYDERSELQTFAYETQAAQVNLAVTKAQYYPIVSVVANAELEQDWTAQANEGSYNLGVSVSAPVWDNGQINAQVKQAAAQIDTLLVQTDQERQAIAIAVANALFGVQDSKNRLDLAQQNVDQAQGTYDLYVAKFEVGLETNLDVLTYSAALTTAQVALSAAKTTYNLSILTLREVMGL